MYAWPLLDLD